MFYPLPRGGPHRAIAADHDGDGDQWWVAAIWPDGQVEDIASFDSEVEANEWIAKDFQRWLEQRNARNEC